MENCKSFRGFGYIYIYTHIYIDYFIYKKWTNGTSKRTCLISSQVIALFPSQFPQELST